MLTLNRKQHIKLRASALLASIALALALTSCASTPAGDPLPPSTPVGSADGQIAEGERVSPLDDHHPAVTNLDPELRNAIRTAAAAAAQDGVEMWVTSGWRTPRLQQQLLDAATIHYASLEEALKWVDTPERSTHVIGKGVDIGPTDADSWLSQHGNTFGLCQTFANEMWHFELAVVPGEVCPSPALHAADR
jgi:D-alanyl-D-alanine carboxypeptidase